MEIKIAITRPLNWISREVSSSNEQESIRVEREESARGSAQILRASGERRAGPCLSPSLYTIPTQLISPGNVMPLSASLLLCLLATAPSN
jgi:hypothetical protein